MARKTMKEVHGRKREREVHVETPRRGILGLNPVANQSLIDGVWLN